MSLINWYSFFLALFMLFLSVYDRSIIRTPNTLALMPFIFTESLKSFAIANLQLVIYIGGGFSIYGDAGCAIIGFIALYGYPLEMISLATITYERYAVIVNSKRQSPAFADTVKKIICGALIMACICTVPLFFGLGYRSAPSDVYCILIWHSREIPDLIVSFTVLAILGLGVVAIVYMQFKIFKLFQRSANLVQQKSGKQSSSTEAKSLSKVISVFQKSANSLQQKSRKRISSSEPRSLDSNSRRKSTLNLDQEKKVFIRAMTFAGVAFLCWTPYVIMIIHNMITGTSIAVFDMVGCFMANSLAPLNLTLMILITPRFRDAAKSFLFKSRN
ncbi:family A G protein-coupled receptor-like protein [Rozella allomycis CSF55]|uniref:Family A G protein-coupled receptor-like protein n=1 Tax=Rozella allomycis (strain CSF55) TaxID=988480 RepID=A0A075AY71_ROZAC|nr:G protein-coupled receptor, rhodopsin-like domain-containing protein [Rozella allomycis CSF55]RKP19640.1 family A G protein-coupled receptor-like protein [Rozella allomycis CSF55]|eukprot:EPZ33637.1 G protein-coupled receptor, rhodopsin-like domain-containing protein [Rozella allomycis CSF55]